MRERSIVDEDIERALAGDPHDRSHARVGREIGGHHFDRHLVRRLEPTLQSLEPLSPACDDDQIVPVGRETLGERLSDP
jgi:hypothetical protein